MPTGPRLLLERVCYHIIMRGNHKQQVFLDEKDCSAYLSRLKKYKDKHSFLLYGFCLMPNHIHIIGQPQESINLAKFMHGLTRSYTAYFNKKYKKVGQLWQGRFKSKVIAKDGYLIDCIQYVENNPVRAQMAKTALDYKWSSSKERLFDKNLGERLLNSLHI